MDIAAGAAQSYVFAVTPSAPIAPTDVQFSFDCANTDLAPVNVGLNTLLLSASTTPAPDIVTLGATFGGDGIVNIPEATGTGAFAVATVNERGADATHHRGAGDQPDRHLPPCRHQRDLRRRKGFRLCFGSRLRVAASGCAASDRRRSPLKSFGASK